MAPGCLPTTTTTTTTAATTTPPTQSLLLHLHPAGNTGPQVRSNHRTVSSPDLRLTNHSPVSSLLSPITAQYPPQSDQWQVVSRDQGEGGVAVETLVAVVSGALVILSLLLFIIVVLVVRKQNYLAKVSRYFYITRKKIFVGSVRAVGGLHPAQRAAAGGAAHSPAPATAALAPLQPRGVQGGNNNNNDIY